MKVPVISAIVLASMFSGTKAVNTTCMGIYAKVDTDCVPKKKITPLMASSLTPYSRFNLMALISIRDVINKNKMSEIKTMSQTYTFVRKKLYVQVKIMMAT